MRTRIIKVCENIGAHGAQPGLISMIMIDTTAPYGILLLPNPVSADSISFPSVI